MKRIILTAVFCVLVSVLCCDSAMAKDPKNINEVLAKSTFLVYGPDGSGRPNSVSYGTAFLVHKPLAQPLNLDALKETGTAGVLMLVTANHVFDLIKSDNATLILRKIEDGNWKEHPVQLALRKSGTELWTKNADSDIAVLPFLRNVNPAELPDIQNLISKHEIEFLPYSALADDDHLRKGGITIGAELSCLGFPKFVGSPGTGRFPLLRGGRLASYPLEPSRELGRFYFDFQVFPGNSGGPVYYRHSYSRIGGAPGRLLTEGIDQALVGLVTEKQFASSEDLMLGLVIPSSIIKDTIDKAPLH